MLSASSVVAANEFLECVGFAALELLGAKTMANAVPLYKSRCDSMGQRPNAIRSIPPFRNRRLHRH